MPSVSAPGPERAVPLAFLVRVVCADDTTSTGVLGVSGGTWGLGSVGRKPGPTDLKSFLRLCERHACNECCVVLPLGGKQAECVLAVLRGDGGRVCGGS